MPDDNSLLDRMYPGMPALPLLMLGSGDRLTREEFERRYAATPQLDWYVWRDGAYSPLASNTQGIIRSLVFSGLWLATIAWLADNIQPVLAVLQQSLYSTEQAAFKQQLVSRG